MRYKLAAFRLLDVHVICLPRCTNRLFFCVVCHLFFYLSWHHTSPSPSPYHLLRPEISTVHQNSDYSQRTGRSFFLYKSDEKDILISQELITKLRTLRLNISLRNWILDFLMGRPQVVRVGNKTSVTLILNTGAPQGWVLSPLLYSLFTQ